MIVATDQSYGREARDRSREATHMGLEGARAALESFYHAFNHRDASLLRAVWAADAAVQLNNPVGGILRGRRAVVALYEQIFSGPARVWVEFHDVVEYQGEGMVVFAGRERGEFRRGDEVVPLAIRTSRVFQWGGEEVGWQQVHHHGSIDDADLLARYQRAVRGA